MQLTDALREPLVLDLTLRAATVATVVVGGRRHAQDPADGLDAEAAAVLVDERGHFGRSASSSFAKYTLADFRISFACAARSSRAAACGSPRARPSWADPAANRCRPPPAGPAFVTPQS